MPRPTYTPPPNDPPVIGSPTFAADADGFLSWFPDFGDYNEALADWYQTGFAKELTNGSAALPSMAFASDLDTGLYWGGANQIGFTAGGTKRALMSTTAFTFDVNVGIGTSVPTEKFHLEDPSGYFHKIKSTSPTGFAGTRMDNDSGASTYGTIYGSGYVGGTTLGIGAGGKSVNHLGGHWAMGTGTAGKDLKFFAGGTTERMRIASDGNVGIGATTAPQHKLDVLGNGMFGSGGDGNALRIRGLGAGGSNVGYLSFYDADGTTRKGYVGYGTTANADLHLTNDTGGLRFVASASTDTLFLAGSTERMRLDSAGRLGINTSAPATRLQIGDGTANVQNKITFGKVETAIESSLPTIQQVCLTYPGSSNDIEVSGNGTSGGVVLSGKQIVMRANGASGYTEYMRILPTGDVGVGTATPDARLELRKAGGVKARLVGSVGNTSWPLDIEAISDGTINTTQAKIGLNHNGITPNGVIRFLRGNSTGDGQLAFDTSDSERIRITNTGKVGIGTSSPSHTLHVNGDALIQGGGGNVLRLAGTGVGSANVSYMAYYEANGTTRQGYVGFGSGLNDQFDIVNDQTNGNVALATGAGGNLIFRNGATERGRFDGSGNFILGKTAPTTAGQGLYYTNGQLGITSLDGYPLILRRDSIGSLAIFANAGTGVGSISITGTATSYNTSSDYRLKENVVPIEGATERLMALKPSRFNFKIEPETTVDGFIAHEVQEVVPEAVTGEKDAEEMQAMDAAKLVPLLTAALQEAVSKIEQLETRLKKLEANG